jgi:hypothetical protein
MNDLVDVSGLIEWDLQIIFRVQKFMRRHPSLDRWFGNIVSKHPWQDICCLIWGLFAVGCYELGIRHFYVVMANLFSCYVLRKLIAAKRPVEYDIRLQPTTDMAAESYGLPSIESYMTVVIMGHLWYHFKSIWLFLLSVGLYLIIAFSRVYAKSRFVYQVAISGVLGLVGLQLGIVHAEKTQLHLFPPQAIWTIAGIFIVALVANFAMTMESNDSRLLYVPKKEFLRVMVDIVDGSRDGELPDDSGRDDGGEQTVDGDLTKVDETPRARSLRKQQEAARLREKRMASAGKRDSFYFLQRSLERRANGQERPLPSPRTPRTPRTPGSTRSGGFERA